MIFTFDLPKSRRIFFGIARFDVMLLLFLLLYLMFVGFLHHLCHLSGFALHVTLWSGKTFVGFPFFGRPKNHSSATCQIESATDPGSTYVSVCVYDSWIAQSYIIALLYEWRTEFRVRRVAYDVGLRWSLVVGVTRRCEAKRGWSGSL